MTELFKDDFKLLHIIEQFGVSKRLKMNLNFGRTLAAILEFCRSDSYEKASKEQVKRDSKKDRGHVQHEFFVCTIQLLHCLDKLMSDAPTHPSVRLNALHLFSQLLYKNVYAVQVIRNTFPSFLLKAVRPFKENKEISEW